MDTDQNAYRCPAGDILSDRFMRVEEDQTRHLYWTNKCGACALQRSAAALVESGLLSIPTLLEAMGGTE